MKFIQIEHTGKDLHKAIHLYNVNGNYVIRFIRIDRPPEESLFQLIIEDTTYISKVNYLMSEEDYKTFIAIYVDFIDSDNRIFNVNAIVEFIKNIKENKK